MKSKSLFPHKYKKVGITILIPSMILGLIALFIDITPNFLDWSVVSLLDRPIIGEKSLVSINQDNVFLEIVGILIIVGGLLTAFSKEKNEDEFISAIRLDALVWALIINYSILIFALILLYNNSFFIVMTFNLFATLIIFILKFNWELRALNKATSYEE